MVQLPWPLFGMPFNRKDPLDDQEIPTPNKYMLFSLSRKYDFMCLMVSHFLLFHLFFTSFSHSFPTPSSFLLPFFLSFLSLSLLYLFFVSISISFPLSIYLYSWLSIIFLLSCFIPSFSPLPLVLFSSLQSSSHLSFLPSFFYLYLCLPLLFVLFFLFP